MKIFIIKFKNEIIEKIFLPIKAKINVLLLNFRIRFLNLSIIK